MVFLRRSNPAGIAFDCDEKVSENSRGSRLISGRNPCSTDGHFDGVKRGLAGAYDANGLTTIGGACASVTRTEAHQNPPHKGNLVMHQLSLFDDHGRPTLRTVFQDYQDHLLSRAEPASLLTIDGYRNTVERWAALVGEVPVSEIDTEIIDLFRQRLAVQPGRLGERLSPATVRRHLANLRALLRFAGPRSSTNRHGLGMIREVPIFDFPRRVRTVPTGDLTLQQIGVLVQAGRGGAFSKPMSSRHGVGAGQVWATWYLAAYYSGLRAGALCRLRWEWIRPEGDGGSVVIPAEVQKRRKSQWQYLHPEALEAMAVIRDERDPWVFPWRSFRTDRLQSIRNAVSMLGRCHNGNLTRCQIPKSPGDALHGLRKSHATELAVISPLAAQISLNHEQSIMSAHYTNHRRILIDAISAMPSPLASA